MTEVDEEDVKNKDHEVRNVVLYFWEGKEDRIISKLDNGKVVLVDEQLKDDIELHTDYETRVLEKDNYGVAYPKAKVWSKRLIVRGDNKVVYLDNTGDDVDQEMFVSIREALAKLRKRGETDKTLELIVRVRDD